MALGASLSRVLILPCPLVLLLLPPFATEALSTGRPPRHQFPRTKYGDRFKVLKSDGYAKAITFLDKVHEERYSTYDECPILGPAWAEYDDKGPLLPPSPIGSLLDTDGNDNVKLQDIFTSYSREQQRNDAVSPVGSSASQLSAEFASIAKKKQSRSAGASKGFGSSRGGGKSSRPAGFASANMKRASETNKGRRKKKWSADSDSDASNTGLRSRKRRSKWSSHDDDDAEAVSPEISADASNTVSPGHSGVKAFLTCPSLFDGNFCHVTNVPVFTADECRAIISEAESDDGASSDAWKSHDQYYKDMKITRRIVEMPQTREFFGRACIERIFPLLQKMYPTACPQGSDGLRDFRIFTAKVLRYDASSGNDYLGVHHDGSLLTFLIGLNDLNEYEGGGTYMEALGKAVRYEAGHLCCHPGIVRHGGDKVKSGIRYVLAAWIDIHGVKEYDRQLCEEADLTRMSGRLDQTIRYDLGESSSRTSDNSRYEKAEQWHLYSLAAGEMYGHEDSSSSDMLANKEGHSTVPRLTSENAWLGLGQLWLDQGKSIEASDAFRNALDLNPYNTRAWISYGLALMNLNDVDTAIHAFKTAADMNEYEFDALSNLGLLFSMLERHQEAADTYERAVGRIQQGSDGSIKADRRAAAELYTNWGVTLCDLGKYQESLVVFAKAVVIDKTFHDAARNLKAVKDALAS